MTPPTIAPWRRCERCDFRHDPDAACVAVDLVALNFELDKLIAGANRSAQYASLAGIGPVEETPCPGCHGRGSWPDCPTCGGTGEIAALVDPLELLRLALKSAYHRVRELQTHAHDWDRGDDERGPTRCTICGADGDA